MISIETNDVQAINVTTLEKNSPDAGSKRRSTPDVIVLGMSTTGLAALRLLGSSGLRCWGLDVDPALPAFHSRFCRRAIVVPRNATDDEVVASLHELHIPASARPLLIPTADRFVWLVHRFRSVLSQTFRVVLPEASVIDDLVDKFRFTQRAAQFELPVPKSFVVANVTELPECVNEDSFPWIVRPRKRCADEGAFPKAVVVRSQADVESLATKYSGVPHPELLVQDFIEGPTDTQLSAVVAISKSHQVVATFSARKIRQGHDVVGVGTYLESCMDTEAEGLAADFLSRLGFVGVAEVEFKRQQTTNQLLALEVNPRLWEQVSLPAAGGLNFAKILYDLSSDGPLKNVTLSGERLGWQDLWDDFYWTFRRGGYWRKNEVTLAGWLQQSFLARGHAHFAWSDPLPAVRRALKVVRSVVAS